jgi:AraC-like DNA-binding protein
MTIEFLDTLLRGIAIGGFLATALVLAFNGKTDRVVWLGLIFFVSAIAHVLDNAAVAQSQSRHHYQVLAFIQNSATSLLWGFLINVFDDTKGRFWLRLIPVGLITSLNLLVVTIFSQFSAFYWGLYHLASISMMAHLIFVMLRGIKGDLVEARRQLRAPLLFLVAGYIGFMAWVDLSNSLCCGSTNFWHVFQAGFLALMALGSTIGFLNAGPVFWGSVTLEPSHQPHFSPEAVDGVERALLTRLQNAMANQEVWKTEGLSIGTLASDLAVPEYRLRRLINERLNYKNFADYINSHRVAAAKAILSDPAQATLSVSQIAFDLGFASLGPFNRAFKQDTQLSPTEWRAQNLANS